MDLHMNREPAGAAASCAKHQPGPRPGSGRNGGKSWENSDACPDTPSLGKQCGGEAPSQELQAGVPLGLQARLLPALPTLNSAGQPFHPCALPPATSDPRQSTLQIMRYAKKHAFVCYKAIVLQISACKIEKPPSLRGDDALWSHFGPALLPAPGPKAPTSAPSLLSKASEETRRPSLSPQPPF